MTHIHTMHTQRKRIRITQCTPRLGIVYVVFCYVDGLIVETESREDRRRVESCIDEEREKRENGKRKRKQRRKCITA